LTLEGEEVGIKVKAITSAPGLYSELLVDINSPLKVIMADVPSTPTSSPSEDTLVTAHDTIKVTYSAPDNGGSDITSYEVQISEEDGSYTTFVGGDDSPYLRTEAQTSINIVKGNTYRIRYRARNLNGWSGYSDARYIVAASAPEPPSILDHYYASGSNFLTLSQSTNGNGSPITHHTLYVDEGTIPSPFSEVT
jgi:hypothetical protein